jgi:hypothetical protein
MGKQKTNKVPEVKDFKGMNIVNSLMYHKEVLKREPDPIKREIIQNRLEKLKIELENYKAV